MTWQQDHDAEMLALEEQTKKTQKEIAYLTGGIVLFVLTAPYITLPVISFLMDIGLKYPLLYGVGYLTSYAASNMSGENPKEHKLEIALTAIAVAFLLIAMDWALSSFTSIDALFRFLFHIKQ